MRASTLSLLVALGLVSSAGCSSTASDASPPAGNAGAAGSGGDSGAAGSGGTGTGGFIGSVGGQNDKTPSPGFDGVYVISPSLTTGGPTITDDVYSLPTFDGVVLRLRWDAFEPQQGKFDFYELDTEMLRAKLAGKKIALALLAGTATPPWVYDTAKATELVFVVPGASAAGDDCQAAHIAAPWDSGFQDAFGGAIAQLGLHLAQIHGGLDDVRMVYLTGIASTSEDIALPSASGGTTPSGCQLTDTTAAWKTAGYRPSKIVDAWSKLTAAYAQAFPMTTLVAPLAKSGFPGIDETGKLVDPSTVDPTKTLVDAAAATLSGRFAVQGADLTQDSTDPVVASALAGGAVAGFRTNDFLGKDGAGCGSDDPTMATACTDSGYGDILHNGVNLGARFLAVRVVEVTQYPGSIEDAQTALSGH